MDGNKIGTSHLTNPLHLPRLWELLTHERRIAQRYHHNVNRIHLDITVASHNKKVDQTNTNPSMNRVMNPNLTSVNLSLSLCKG